MLNGVKEVEFYPKSLKIIGKSAKVLAASGGEFKCALQLNAVSLPAFGSVIAININAVGLTSETGYDFVPPVAIEVDSLDRVSVKQPFVNHLAPPAVTIAPVNYHLVSVPRLDRRQKALVA